MAIFYTALHIFQSLLGLAPREEKSRGATDWLKLALAVAAQPEDDESTAAVRVALQTNNQVFLDYLRTALDNRTAAAARVADINEGIECRAFLPGSPALWGWTTNMPAESAILQAGIEAAMDSSVFDSPPASCSKTGKDVFIGLGSSEAMGGATLRDIYAKAWELHREPLIWTPRGPGAGVGASTWTLTPAAFAGPARTRNRSRSDASEARSSVIGLSPCLYAQRNRVRRDSVHDVFGSVDAKFQDQPSPLPDTGIITPSPTSSALLPSVELERPIPRIKQRSISCTRSHVSSTTAATVSECSTTQELSGFGLGLSLGGSTWSRPATPAESCFADNELDTEVVSKGKRSGSYRLLGARGRAPSGTGLPRREISSIDNSKHFKARRPGATPLQRMQPSAPRQAIQAQGRTHTTSTSDNTPARNNIINRLVAGTPSKPHDRLTSLRRIQSAAVLHPSPAPKVPLVGPVPASKRVSGKQDTPCRTAEGSLRTSTQDKQAALSRRPSNRAPLASTPVTPRAVSGTRCVTPQSRIPRPPSRAESISARTVASVRAISTSPSREPQQLLTPASTARRVRERASFTQAPRVAVSRARSQTGRSTQERPVISKDTRVSRPPSRSHLAAGSSSVVRHRTKRSDSITSVSTMVDRWESTEAQVVAV